MFGIIKRFFKASHTQPRRTLPVRSAKVPIRTKVVGVSFEDRQQVIEAHVREGMRLLLEREPENPHDPNAIGVWIERPCLKIGYLNRDLAARLRDEGDLTATVVAVVGGGWRYEDCPGDVFRDVRTRLYFGVDIAIER